MDEQRTIKPLTLVDYSDKAIAVATEFDTALKDEFKHIGGRFNSRLQFGAGWIFSKKKHEDQIIALFNDMEIFYTMVALADMPIVRTTDKGDKGGKNKIPEFIKIDKDGDMIVELDCGKFVEIHKQSLETSFCFGYGYNGIADDDSQDAAYNAAERARTDEQYFINENLKELDRIVQRLSHDNGWMDENDYPGGYWAWLDCGNYRDENRASLSFSQACYNSPSCLDEWERNKYEKGLYLPLSSSDRAKLLAAYLIAFERRQKRCENYIKRFGTSKLKIWTYLRD